MTYAIVSEPQSGTITDLNEDTGSLVYTSDAGFTGKDSFTFNANDGTVDSNTATVTITVNAISPQPEPEPEALRSEDSTPPTSGEDSTPPTSGKDSTPPTSGKDSTPPTSKPSGSNSTNISSGGGLFSDGFPGFTDNMKNLFGN